MKAYLKKGFTTQVLHHDRLKIIEHGSIHKPIHTAITYGYTHPQDLIAVFQSKKSGFRYSRQGNPTVTALEEKITSMEEGVGSICFSTGMAAIGALFQALLREGDHVVVSQFLFGNTLSMFQTLSNQGLQVTWVDATKASEVEQAIRPNTRMVFVETIANPATQVADLQTIGHICKQRDVLYVIDSTMTSPYLLKAKDCQASLVMHSLSKIIGGHADALGGSLTDTGLYNWKSYPHIAENFKKQADHLWGLLQIRTKALRDFGASLSPESAHIISRGLETLALRCERACENALALATMLVRHPKIKKVNYPGLENHAQHLFAKQNFNHFGYMMSFEISDAYQALDFLEQLEVPIHATHLGDNRTLVIPVAQTIFFEYGVERRAAMGIGENLIRVSVGIEDISDLLNDFMQALEQL